MKIWGILTSIRIISCFRQIWSVHDLFVIPKTFVQISWRFLSVHVKVHLISWYLTWCGRICHKEVLKFCVPYFVRSHEKKLNLSPKFDQLNGESFLSHISTKLPWLWVKQILCSVCRFSIGFFSFSGIKCLEFLGGWRSNNLSLCGRFWRTCMSWKTSLRGSCRLTVTLFLRSLIMQFF